MERQLALVGGEPTIDPASVKPWPVITEEDKRAVRRALDYGIFSNDTPEIEALQSEWAEYVGVRHCLVTNSGTSALHMSVAAAGIGPGDEVLMPAYSFIATATSVLHHNAIPTFVDVDPETWNMDPTAIEGALTPATKALMPVHLNGHPADMDQINAIAEHHDLVVIEDACQSHGAEYRGSRTGSLGHLSGFSLNSWKNLPGGDGGLFCTDDDDYHDRAKMVREFGERVIEGGARDYRSYAMGWMYRSTDLVAALVRSQLRRLDEMNACRVQNARSLADALEQYRFVRTPTYAKPSHGVYWSLPLELSPEEAGFDLPRATFRDAVAAALRAEGLRCASWQTCTLPEQRVIRDKVGYGKGSPWTEPSYVGEVSYEREYPVAKRVAESTTWLFNMFTWPNGAREVDQAAAAFDKVFNQLDVVVDAHTAAPQ